MDTETTVVAAVKRKAVARAKHQLRVLELRHARPRRIRRAKARVEKRRLALPKKVVTW